MLILDYSLWRQFFPKLSKDYVFGLVLLGIVLLLWTLSNFITQVSGTSTCCSRFILSAQLYIRLFYKTATKNRSCTLTMETIRRHLTRHRVTYLNTSSFALYLVPFLWRRRKQTAHNGSLNVEVDHRRAGE